MDETWLYASEGENPLDRIVPDGGFCGIFRTVGIIGDSLASGELESFQEGIRGFHDFYEYSWGQYMARTLGNKVYNFSCGGMTAQEFEESFAEKCGVYSYENLCQAYIIALGVNDSNRGFEVGDVESAYSENPSPSNQTFSVYYARIIKSVKAKQPQAKIFLITMPLPVYSKEKREIRSSFNEAIRGLSEKFSNTYVIDLEKYAPLLEDRFRKTFFRGHMTVAGYLAFSKIVMSYIDWIVRNHHEEFAEVGFIGTPYRYS